MTLARKLTHIVLVMIGVAVLGLAVAVVATAVRPARAIGMQQVMVPDTGHAPIRVTILYPTTAKPRWTWFGMAAARLAPDGAVDGTGRPLVVISEGTGGTSMSHLDTALALAQAGYVVAAPLHTGDNFQDDSNVGTGDWMVDRARHIARVNDHLLGRWAGQAHLDPAKVGLFGFSAGGTTGLITIGGTPDFTQVGPHCAATPEFVCKLLKPGEPLRVPAASEWTHDRRVKAAVIVAPGFGFTFAPRGLAGVDVPVQLWAGTADDNVPPATNAEAVRRALPDAPEFHLVERARHFSFLPPCGLLQPLLPAMLCADADGFDRAAFHKEFNDDVVAFFDTALHVREAGKGTGGTGD
jgi:predicted dienelactone hydrolase